MLWVGPGPAEGEWLPCSGGHAGSLLTGAGWEQGGSWAACGACRPGWEQLVWETGRLLGRGQWQGWRAGTELGAGGTRGAVSVLAGG